jgi:hypothetical protein
MPAWRVIILERQGDRFGYVLRADVPAGREPFYAQPEYVSSASDAADPDLTAIRAGSVTERISQLELDKQESETVPQAIARVQGQLETMQAVFQAEVTARNTWSRFGTFWDGTAWTVRGA